MRHRTGRLGCVVVSAALLVASLAAAEIEEPSVGTQQAVASAPASQVVSPAEWLSPEGKNEKWLEATAVCRQMLARLDPADPLVARHLERVSRQAELVGRADSFNWKTITAVDVLANTLIDLLAGKEPNVRYAGQQLGFAYWSDTMRRIEAIWIHVPPDYDPTKDFQIFLYYKSGGGIHYHEGRAAGGYRPTIEMANRVPGTFHAWSSQNIQLKGRLGAHIELAEATAALSREFAINPNRVFLTGYSDGGFTALWLASRYPHLVAGLAPNCANWQYTNVEQVGLYDTPLLVVDGWGDGGYIETNLNRFFTLANMGYDVSAVIGHHGHNYAPFEEEATFRHILDWASGRQRDVTPWRVRYATWNLAWNRAYWLTIRRMVDPCLPAQVDARIKDGNVIDVQAWNVAAYDLQLHPDMFNAKRTMRVYTNGQSSYNGPYKPELAVEVAPRPRGRFVKDAAMHGGLTAVLDACTYDANGYLAIPGRQWLHVRGTGGGDEMQERLAKWFPQGAKADTEVTEEDIASHNLFLYGGPQIHAITARIAADLPVQFGEGWFRIGRVTYDQPTHCVAFIHPNPLNPAKYVIVYAFNDAAAFAEHKYFDLTDAANVWKFRMGDGVIRGLVPQAGKTADAEADVDGGAARPAGEYGERHFIFDAAWGTAWPVIGRLADPLDRDGILRLRASAVREAANADVGIIWQDTPDYLRWSGSLPTGPVSLHDLATLDALPEYIVVGEMAGSQLQRARPAAWTIAGDAESGELPADHIRAADLDPDRTYAVAMGYYGIPAFRTNPSQMPQPYTFASEEEFLGREGNDIHVRNMRQLPVSVAEAVGQYIQARSSGRAGD